VGLSGCQLAELVQQRGRALAFTNPAPDPDDTELTEMRVVAPPDHGLTLRRTGSEVVVIAEVAGGSPLVGKVCEGGRITAVNGLPATAENMDAAVHGECPGAETLRVSNDKKSAGFGIVLMRTKGAASFSVESLRESGLAYLAGLRAGDTLLEVNSVAVTGQEQLNSLLRTSTHWQTVELRIIRGRRARPSPMILTVQVPKEFTPMRLAYLTFEPKRDEAFGRAVGRANNFIVTSGLKVTSVETVAPTPPCQVGGVRVWYDALNPINRSARAIAAMSKHEECGGKQKARKGEFNLPH